MRRHPPSSPRSSARRRLWILGGALGAIALAIVCWLLWPRDPYALPASDWRTFKKCFLSPEGRIVDTGNGNISHSEGQGYGMVLAVAFNDRRTFDRLWNWTQQHLKRKDDFLFSWKWAPENGGKIADPNNATDGDLLIAWALQRAFEKWNDYSYQKAAAQIVADILEKTTVETYLGLQFLPGLEGFQKENGVLLNPSYYVFPALDELAAEFPSEKWAALQRGGDLLLRTARFSQWSLSPDWAFVGNDWVAIGDLSDPNFGYNAIRVPLHVAWQNSGSLLLEPFAKFWESLPTGAPVPATVNLLDGKLGADPALPGMLAVRQLTLACVKNDKLTVREIPPLDSSQPYYSASLTLLVKLAIHESTRPKRN